MEPGDTIVHIARRKNGIPRTAILPHDPGRTPTGIRPRACV
jgi:hypothetical protein